MTIQVTISAEHIAELKKLAEENCACDAEDFNAYDYSGGNYDDAYDQGQRDGERLQARWVLDMLGIEYNDPSVQ